MTDTLVVRGVRVAVEITSGLTLTLPESGPPPPPPGDFAQLAPASEQAPSV
ncbi:MAG: hypothetical protein WBV96_17290 [Polyangia bacterium]